MTENLLLKPSPKPWVPHGYQKKSVKFLLEHACTALLQDPGLGKTSSVLAAIKVLQKKKMPTKTLIVAPLQAATDTWPGERDKWTDFNHFDMVVLHGPKKEQLLHEDHDIYLINPEGLEWLFDVTKTKTPRGKVKVDINVKRLKDLGFDILVLDELSLFKHTNTNRFKALKIAVQYFGRRWGLTGSPAANGLMDLFGQCYLLDLGRTFGPYITHFRTQYFDQNPFNQWDYKLKEGAEEAIYKRLSPLALTMSADDYLELPEFVPVDVKVKLPDPVYEMYYAMEENLIAEIGRKTVTASSAGVASGKLRQIANGGIYLNELPMDRLAKARKSDREWEDLHMCKAEAVAELVEELQGKPLLVAYDFEHDLGRLRKVLGKNVPYIGGGVPTGRRTEIARQWNAGKLPVLLGHPQSIARGLNLQESGNHVCWHSLTWNFELYDQFNRRILRQGNKAKKVFCYRLVAAGTIDHVMLASLKNKDTTQRSLFQGLKELARKHR